MAPSPERLAANQMLIREVNERIRGLADRQLTGLADPLDGRVPFLCECGDAGCDALVPLPRADYMRFRAETTWFFVAAGHEPIERGRVVEAHAGFTVVEASPVETTDPLHPEP